jgi:gamma-glutamylcyclotransferase (GGCT)/AIG2-like uncharacterized protein YtfP
LPARAELLLFAYGTLMRGYGLHDLLARGADFVALGTARGRLLDLGRYPGVVQGRGRVTGEVYRLRDPQVLPAVDRAEGVQFLRGHTLVTLADGGRARAWIYRYRGPRERAVPIPDGDYRRARPARSKAR